MDYTIEQLSAATSDQALRSRAELAARTLGLTDASGAPLTDQQVTELVWANWTRVVSATIPDGQGTTTPIAAHAYASSIREQALAQVPPPPGANPAAVTDAQLVAALRATFPMS